MDVKFKGISTIDGSTVEVDANELGSGGAGGFVEENGQYKATAPDGTTMILSGSNDGKGIQIHSGWEMLDISSQKGIGLSAWNGDPIFLRADDLAGNQASFQVGPSHIIMSMRDGGRFEIFDSDGTVIGGVHEDGTATGVFAPAASVKSVELSVGEKFEIRNSSGEVIAAIHEDGTVEGLFS